MDMNTVNHLLSTTRTVRKRLDFDRAVEPAVIQECSGPGHPSAKRLQQPGMALHGRHGR